MIIGSHVGLKADDYFLGSVKEALSYGATALMIYTGAPQNTFRKSVELLNIEEGRALLQQVGIPIEHVIVHAPYIINLGNTKSADTYELATSFLSKEILRVKAFGAKVIVLHPGAHVGEGSDVGITSIINGLNMVLKGVEGVTIALETMAGKGSECGRTFEEIKTIIDGVENKACISVCLDTCHVHDAGYDVSDVDGLLQHFDEVIGLEHLSVVHINDSKNPMGAAKDRHENLGYGYIGFKTLHQYVTHPKLAHIPKILETPYVMDLPPYKQEIEMLKHGQFIAWRDE
ncbi:MAG: deoxyribonuclease IV [Erysipelothrix sp.]|jgi:deoxyribonuclease-4|nr:deoxyribonuclease IV [Erysipelothrix sp.]